VVAVREGRFHVYAVETIPQGIEILTGLPAGERRPNGSFTPGTVFARVARVLGEYAEKSRAFGAKEG
jgi:hypothetical protein